MSRAFETMPEPPRDEADLLARARGVAGRRTRDVAARFGVIRCHGETPFIAAARCFVKSVCGPEITVQMAG